MLDSLPGEAKASVDDIPWWEDAARNLVSKNKSDFEKNPHAEEALGKLIAQFSKAGDPSFYLGWLAGLTTAAAHIKMAGKTNPLVAMLYGAIVDEMAIWATAGAFVYDKVSNPE